MVILLKTENPRNIYIKDRRLQKKLLKKRREQGESTTSRPSKQGPNANY